jgi:hypothetical protein
MLSPSSLKVPVYRWAKSSGVKSGDCRSSVQVRPSKVIS